MHRDSKTMKVDRIWKQNGQLKFDWLSLRFQSTQGLKSQVYIYACNSFWRTPAFRRRLFFYLYAFIVVYFVLKWCDKTVGFLKFKVKFKFKSKTSYTTQNKTTKEFIGLIKTAKNCTSRNGHARTMEKPTIEESIARKFIHFSQVKEKIGSGDCLLSLLTVHAACKDIYVQERIL